MKKNIVFLDIDGVVNTLQINDKPFNNDKGVIFKDNFYFKINSPEDEEVSNKQAILWLNKLCLETNSIIVITSTWRLGKDGLHRTKKALYNSGLDERIIIHDDVTPSITGNERGKEIDIWLQRHLLQFNNYVVLDDDDDHITSIARHWVHCDTYHGFGCSEYIQAKRILIAFN